MMNERQEPDWRLYEQEYERAKNHDCYDVPPICVGKESEYREQKDTTFKPGEDRAVVAGRNGGIKSGETRRRKAQKRQEALETTADVIYSAWLQDVTEDELNDFIRWRGQRKRKATLARQRLQNIADGDPGSYLVEQYRQCKKFFDMKHRSGWIRALFGGISWHLTFDQARDQAHNNRQLLNNYVSEIVSDMVKIAYWE